MKKLIIIIPVYNEELTINHTVELIFKQKKSLNKKGVQLAIFIINDGSTDSTAKRLKNSNVDRILTHSFNQGLGASVRTGLLAAKEVNADIVVKVDADLQHNPKDILNIIEPILQGEADVVYGDRTSGIAYKMPFIRKIGNIAFTKIMQWLTKWPLRDSQPGIFAVNSRYLAKFYIPGNYNYTQQILLDAYYKGMRFAHVKVSFNKRKTGNSFVTLKYPFKVLSQLFWIIVGLKPLKVFVPISLFFFIIGSGLFIYEFYLWIIGSTSKPVLHVNLLLGLYFFSIQCFFFGIIAELIARGNKN